MNKTKSVLFLLIISAVMISYCKNEEPVYDYQCGNPNYEQEYYSANTKRVSFNDDSYLYTVLKNNDDYCFVTQDRDEGAFAYTVYVYDDSLDDLKNTYTLDICSEVYSFCLVGNDIIACSTSNGFAAFSIDSGERLFSSAAEDRYNRPIITSFDDGLILISDEQACKYDSDGKKIDMIEYDNIGFPSWGCAAFVQRGKIYYVNQEMNIYQIDFENNKATYQFNLNELGTPFDLGQGGKYYDYLQGEFYEIDMMSKTREICAVRNHMLIPPRVYNKNYEDGYFFVDRYNYIITYSYPDGSYDANLVYKDDSLNIGDRNKILIKGYGVNDDLCLLRAAYDYNTSQDNSFVEVESYGEEYYYSTAIEAQNIKLQLIQEFNSGNAPDIYYGNFFDYDYWGRNGMVLDLKDRIDTSDIINDSSIISNFYDLMYHDGHCYSLFSGYRINGIVSANDRISPNIPIDYNLYSNASFSDGMRGYYLSSDIVDFIVRYPLKRLISENDFLTLEEIENILEYGYSIGMSNQEKYGENSIIINGDEGLSVKQAVISSISGYSHIVHDLGPIRYYGYPTVGGTVNTVEPFGLVAISSGSEYPEECFDFMEYLFSEENQQELLIQQVMPVRAQVSDKYIQYMFAPETIPDDEEFYKNLANEMRSFNFDLSHDPQDYYHLSDSEERYFKEMISSVNSIITMDWGVYNIIAEEVESYYLQNKPVSEIAESLLSRLSLYVQENY